MKQQTQQTLPKQKQDKQPGIEAQMNPQPKAINPNYKRSGKLAGRTAIITGGDSGIGKSVAIYYAKEGANIAIAYLEEDQDAEATKHLIEQEGSKCLFIRGDVGQEAHCIHIVEQVIATFGTIDILVNNAAEQHPQTSLVNITEAQLEKTFRTNIYSYFFLTKAVLPHLKQGSAIINTASITAYKGNPTLIDYSATKGAIVAFTRSLSQSIVKNGIRVNAVAPGPIWTPLIPASFTADEVSIFGASTPMGRPGQPAELAPTYVYLASDDASYITGQTIHVNGGEVVNG